MFEVMANNFSMRVGISARHLRLGNEFAGGIGIYTESLMQALADNHCEIIPYNCYPFLLNMYQDLKRILMSRSTLNNILSSKSVGCSLNKISKTRNTDIKLLHVTDYIVPKLKAFIPIVATLYDAIFLKHPDWCNIKLRHLKNIYLKKCMLRAQHFVVPSHVIVNDIVHYWGIKPEKISVIYPGIDTDFQQYFYPHEVEYVLNKYKLEPGFLLFAGILQPRKNVERIVDAYTRLPKELKIKHKLVIVGRNGWQTQTILPKLCALELAHLGKWLKYISRKDLRILYHCASLVVFPSLSEGFGYPIIEGFLSKTPVITSNISSMLEIAGQAAYLVDPYSQDEINQAMITLLTDAHLREMYIKRGEQRVKFFKWDKNVHQLLALYESLL